MKVYDTSIMGSGYFSAGYVLSRGSSLICEEHRVYDIGFYLPMRCFSYKSYEPKTEEGRALFGVFNETSLFGEPAHAEICDFIDHILRLTNT